MIKGLRGQPPFDGSQFPPLPWGGRAIGEEEIQELADWIDDGCPPEESQSTAYPLHNWKSEISTEVLKRDICSASEQHAGTENINEYKFQHGELRQRMNVDCLLPSQLEKLRFAFRELYALNKWPEDARNYNNLALIHQNHCQHGWERFLPWHRIYLYEFELALQDRRNRFHSELDFCFSYRSRNPATPIRRAMANWSARY